ncbi:MAG TPA: potassium channel family protein [Planctomycetaceae bacterium]|nr:potassium channel family protein [Planctomycetaceae bacterium]
MHFLAALLGIALIGLILFDAFEAVLLPRRVTHAYRLVRLFYRTTWPSWKAIGKLLNTRRRREAFLSTFAPLSFLMMFATWALGMILGFALLHWGCHTQMAAADPARTEVSYLYFSGVTFFTVGYGDLSPVDGIGRFLAVFEAGLGFGFLALVLSYHPILAQAFSQREIVISLLDARGGSPPTAEQVLVRSQPTRRPDLLNSYFLQWEVWSAELLERCLSFQVLGHYRSQHDNQSWLAALTVILDTSALVICGGAGRDPYQARLAFAMARHAAVDLCLVYKIPPRPPEPNRLPAGGFQILFDRLKAAGGVLPAEVAETRPAEVAAMETRLAELRRMYEPFVNAMSQYFSFPLPSFYPERLTADNWQTSAWMPRVPGIRELPGQELSELPRGEHFV